MQIAGRLAVVLALLFWIAGAQVYAQTAQPPSAPSGALASVLGTPLLKGDDTVNLTSGTYAVFHTSEGDFLAELRPDWAPQAVANFTQLSRGGKKWKHPVTQVESLAPLYSNTTVYRTIPNAMVFGGDPINRGEGDSGDTLPLETVAGVSFDQAGLLAMDGSGSRMSGSRWFITLRAFPERTGNYTVFGRVIGGLDLVQRISLKPVKRPQLPLDPVTVFHVEIVTIPAGRVTTGNFQAVDGMKVLRIDPNFRDAPVQTRLAAPETTTVTGDGTEGSDDEDAAAEKTAEGKGGDSAGTKSGDEKTKSATGGTSSKTGKSNSSR